MEFKSKIFVAGHRGMVGSAITRKLRDAGYDNLVERTSAQLDLRDQAAVKAFFETEAPDYVFLAAARVGGILANSTYKADFIYDNLMIQTNIIHSAHLSGVKKLLFLGSSCIYPKLAKQPIREEYLLGGYLEPTNDAYALAKIAGLKMCASYREQYGCNFISTMPTNLYGPNDNYDPQGSHVLPALLRKFHEAHRDHKPEVTIWGTGTPKREFLHVDDLADACLYLMDHYEGADHVNVGTGKDLAIGDLALLVKRVVGYEGKLTFDTSKPDGTPRKQLDVSKLKDIGWSYAIELEDGVTEVYRDVLARGFFK